MAQDLNRHQSDLYEGNNLGLGATTGAAIGLIVGAPLGVVLGNILLGIPIGLVAGAIIGSIMGAGLDRRAKQQNESGRNQAFSNHAK